MSVNFLCKAPPFPSAQFLLGALTRLPASNIFHARPIGYDKQRPKKKKRSVFHWVKFCAVGGASCLVARRLFIIHTMNKLEAEISARIAHDSALMAKEDPSFAYVFLRSLRLAAMFLPLTLTSPLAFVSTVPCLRSIGNVWWWCAERTVNSAGPAWIKLAQWLSTRPDIVPPSVCARLSLFQADCATHSFSDTLKIIQRFVDIEKTFTHINPVPMASGSVGQVYEATLRSPFGSLFGSRVVLKVVHPGVSKPVRADLRIFNGLACVLSHMPFFRSIPLRESLVAFREQMMNHLDLRREAANLCKFNTNFSSLRDVCIRFPRPFRGLVEREFFVESFEPGVPVNQVADGKDMRLRSAVARLCMDGFLKMMFRDNFMHMDLHPGNILVQRPSLPWCSPRVVFLDPGLTASLSKEKMKNFCEMCCLVSTKRSREAAAMMIDRGPKDTKCSPKQRGI